MPPGAPRSRGVRVGVAPWGPAVGAFLDGNPDRLEHAAGGEGDLDDRGLERLAVADGRFAVPAELADELASGGFDFPGRRGRLGATKGLDASAHGFSLHRARY